MEFLSSESLILQILDSAYERKEELVENLEKTLEVILGLSDRTMNETTMKRINFTRIWSSSQEVG